MERIFWLKERWETMLAGRGGGGQMCLPEKGEQKEKYTAGREGEYLLPGAVLKANHAKKG